MKKAAFRLKKNAHHYSKAVSRKLVNAAPRRSAVERLLIRWIAVAAQIVRPSAQIYASFPRKFGPSIYSIGFGFMLSRRRVLIRAAGLMILIPSAAHSNSWLKQGISLLESVTSATSQSGLANDEIIIGLKEALKVGPVR